MANNWVTYHSLKIIWNMGFSWPNNFAILFSCEDEGIVTIVHLSEKLFGIRNEKYIKHNWRKFQGHEGEEGSYLFHCKLWKRSQRNKTLG